MLMKTNSPLDSLIRSLSALPGLGPRSARRMALYLLSNKEKLMLPLIESMRHVADTVKTCETCGNLDIIDPCAICCDPARESNLICVVAHVADLWAIERTHAFKGKYHVLGGVLSALDGVGPENLSFEALEQRVRGQASTELILALSATVDGQSTAHYIADMFAGSNTVKITRLAHGVPVGGELDYLDDGTITAALRSRSGF